ncbi:hypothetical protein DRJ22_01065 [Candidatus Woesearchaeota archaeon]|nr:MAG: hypothetical protein DRJ22_01065 [Candidatus Woesearchaeota archaeon]
MLKAIINKAVVGSPAAKDVKKAKIFPTEYSGFAGLGIGLNRFHKEGIGAKIQAQNFLLNKKKTAIK